MSEEELRKLFLDRLDIEMQLFKDSMLCKSKEDIYSESFVIGLYENLYEILVIHTEEMSEELLRKLIYQPSGILDALYWDCSSPEESYLTELKEYVEDELKVLSEVKEAEKGNGEENGK